MRPGTTPGLFASKPCPPPAWVRGDAAPDWTRGAARLGLTDPEDPRAQTLGRYCNLLARYRELERFVSSGGAGGSTHVRRGQGGAVLSVREFPQAAELRWTLAALLRYEAALFG